MNFESLKMRFPYLSLRGREELKGIYEPSAGYINPHEMINANNTLTRNANGNVLEGVVTCIEMLDDNEVECTVEVCQGEKVIKIKADMLVVACGGLTAHVLSMIQTQKGVEGELDEPPFFPAHRVSKRTVCLAEVNKLEDIKELEAMPCIKLQLPRPLSVSSMAPSASHSTTGEACNLHDKVEATSVYILPPIMYPTHGKAYIKLGGGPNAWLDAGPETEAAKEELKTFMRTEGEEEVTNALYVALTEDAITFGGVHVADKIGKACYTSCSQDDVLAIREVSVRPRIVAIGICQGKCAAPAVAVGEEVASLLELERE